MSSPSPDEIWRKMQEDVADTDRRDGLRPLTEPLAQWSAPQPSPAETRQLLTQLLPELPSPHAPLAASPPRPLARLTESWPWLLIRGELRVVRREIWLAAAFLMALGVLVTLLSSRPDEPGLLFVLVAPLIAAATIAFIYGPEVDPAQELVQATPVPITLLLLTRLLLVFSFDLVLALVGSVVLTLLQPDIQLWPLIQSWLAPMTFLSALAFCLTVFTRKAEAGILFSLALWFTQVMINPNMIRVWLGFWPDSLAASAQPWLWGLAVVLGGIGLWWAGWSEGWLVAGNNGT